MSLEPGREPVIVDEPQGAEPVVTAAALGLGKPPRAVILLLGGAEGFKAQESAVRERFGRLCEEAIIPAAIESGAVIVDGGTRSGIMETIGMAAALRPDPPALIGIAPKELVAGPGAAAELSS